MKKSLLFIILLIPSCGKINHHIDGSVNINGNVTVTHQFSLVDIQNYFLNECKNELGLNATPEQIATCEQQKTDNFLNFISGNHSGT